MVPLYSVVVHPPEHIIQEVKTLKKLLSDAAGPYASHNSLAHITFNLFSGNEATLARWEDYVAFYVKYLKPFTVCFNSIAVFNNGAFVLKADAASHERLVPVMKNFFKAAPPYPYGKSTNPHISIGRKLTPEQLAIAKKLITEVHLEFICDNLTIRKFNSERGQYDIHKHFPWGGAS